MTDNSSNKEEPAASVPSLDYCSKCGAAVAASAKFCSNCGQKQHTEDAWYYRPIWIVVLALFVLGPFALFLVWKSKRMGLLVKVIFSTAILVYTFYCGVLTYKITMIELKQFNEINAIMNEIVSP